MTSLAPLIFVVVTTALKQGYEDWLRHKTDRATNNRLVPVLRGEDMIKIKSEQIRVGDVVMIENSEEIPCDMVMISSDDHDGKGHVTTANLDGETNLKASAPRYVLVLESVSDVFRTFHLSLSLCSLSLSQCSPSASIISARWL